ncbi:MAG TPA: hypothetical protein PKJ41_13215 [Bryobacteraceae bacterium]|nr:hypothetical protein [Bryobacteraceae bacterium]
MRSSQESEAKDSLPGALNQEEPGQQLNVARHKRAIAAIAELRRKAGRTTTREILSARDNGRRG